MKLTLTEMELKTGKIEKARMKDIQMRWNMVSAINGKQIGWDNRRENIRSQIERGGNEETQHELGQIIRERWYTQKEIERKNERDWLIGVEGNKGMER